MDHYLYITVFQTCFKFKNLDCSVPPQRDMVDRVEASVVLSGESTSIFLFYKNTYYFVI